MRSFLFYDFETWGVQPAFDYPSQFAALRTDEQFNIIDEPINIFSKISPEVLPQPEAALITGITPQQTLQQGLPEYEFAAQIAAQMSQANTTVLGYNSFNFDDEMTRFLFYRNFLPVYEREWQHNNSRYDVYSLVRAVYALRPEGIIFPKNDNGQTSFKLADLAKANNLEHTHAHDALSDVYATVSLLKLISERLPRMWSFAQKYHRKQDVLRFLQHHNNEVLIYIDPYQKAVKGFITLIYPLREHPELGNSIIAADLGHPVDDLITLDAAQLQDKLPSKQQDTPRLVTIKLNQAPFLAPLNTLPAEQAAKFVIDIDLAKRRAEYLHQHFGDKFNHKLGQLYQLPEKTLDAQAALYSDGFITPQEAAFCQTMRAQLKRTNKQWPEPPSTRMGILQGRFLAKYFNAACTAEQRAEWQQFLTLRWQSKEQLIERINELSLTHPQQSELLDAVRRYMLTMPF